MISWVTLTMNCLTVRSKVFTMESPVCRKYLVSIKTLSIDILCSFCSMLSWIDYRGHPVASFIRLSDLANEQNELRLR